MILIPILLITAITALTFSEPAPVNKTSQELYREAVELRK